jgi:putative transposase
MGATFDAAPLRPPGYQRRGYVAYYHRARTHLALAKDTPMPRRVQNVTEGDVIAFREVGGLHHRCERRAA